MLEQRPTDIPLSTYAEPIKSALEVYQAQTGGELVFDLEQASELQLTPEKPNYARSQSPVTFLSEKIGSLFVIAFKPGDGTGSEENFQLRDLHLVRTLPPKPAVVQRYKRDIYAEIHLPLLAHPADQPEATPELFAGLLTLTGLSGRNVYRSGKLGNVDRLRPPAAQATFTTGFYLNYGFYQRFSDPHAVYNAQDSFQIAAFFAISYDVQRRHPHILRPLKPKYPFSI